MSNAEELRWRLLEEQQQRDAVESERIREELEKRSKDSADTERVLRDLENKINQGRPKP